MVVRGQAAKASQANVRSRSARACFEAGRRGHTSRMSEPSGSRGEEKRWKLTHTTRSRRTGRYEVAAEERAQEKVRWVVD